MLRYKKRIRRLAEECNATVEYGKDDSMRVCCNTGTVTFTPMSFETMACRIDLGNGPREFPLRKSYVFDVVDRLASSHLAATLSDYPTLPILDIDDYITDEQGLPFLLALQEELSTNPTLVHKELGGNRILAKYFRGVLILRDDLVMAGTNVIEFGPSSPTLTKSDRTKR
jgi:hypothetical protein